MDLRTGASPWNRPIPTSLGNGPLQTDERCDVAVVGSGLSGAMTAFHLAQAGADVVIIDQRPLSTGSTPVTTALIQYELDVPMVELIPRLGLADAQAVYRTTRGALDDMRDLIESNAIECDFIQRPSLFLAREADDVIHLKHEAIAREQIGIEASFVEANALRENYRIDRPGAIRSTVSYELDPRRLAAHLLADSAMRGARIYDCTALISDNPTGSLPVLTSKSGHRIVAESVVFATGYEAPTQFPWLGRYCSLSTTYALATQPLPEEQLWPERALLWELADPYFYARTMRDNRVIVGGEDDFTLNLADRDALLPGKARRLLKQLESVTGMKAELDHAWAATFARTADGLPFVGATEDEPHCFFNLGYGGNGILFGLIGAQVIRDTIAGRHHPAARLFGFGRHSLSRFGGLPVQTCRRQVDSA